MNRIIIKIWNRSKNRIKSKIGRIELGEELIMIL